METISHVPINEILPHAIPASEIHADTMEKIGPTLEAADGLIQNPPALVPSGELSSTLITDGFADLAELNVFPTSPTPKRKKDRTALLSSRGSGEILTAVDRWISETNLDRGLPQIKQLAASFQCGQHLMGQIITVLRQEGKIPDPAPRVRKEQIVFAENATASYMQLPMPLPLETKKSAYTQLALTRRLNLTATIANRLRPGILKTPESMKIPTIEEIAEREKCSKTTVGKAIQQLASEGLIALFDTNQRQLGYFRTGFRQNDGKKFAQISLSLQPEQTAADTMSAPEQKSPDTEVDATAFATAGLIADFLNRTNQGRNITPHEIISAARHATKQNRKVTRVSLSAEQAN